MKKRSVLSAVAMLLVSALVLTSATYAWFTSNNAATLNEISAQISNNDGSILISADGGTSWKTQVAVGTVTSPVSATAYGDFTASTLSYPGITTASAGELTPVSCTPSATTMYFMNGTLTGVDFTSASTTAGYIRAAMKIKVTVDCDIEIDPDFSTAFDYGYCYLIVDGTGYLYSINGSRSYYPIAYSAGTVNGTDANGNSIMDSGELTGGATLASAAQSVAANNITLSADTNDEFDVVVYMWAEGQDGSCYGTTGGDISCGITFTKTVTTTAP